MGMARAHFEPSRNLAIAKFAKKIKQKRGFFKGKSAQIKNICGGIVLSGRLRMDEYVKGPEPDRWHWSKSCKQYPRVVIYKRSNRPSSDLCDDCLDIERVALRKIAPV